MLQRLNNTERSLPTRDGRWLISPGLYQSTNLLISTAKGANKKQLDGDLKTYLGQGRLSRAEQREFLSSRTCSLLSVSASTLCSAAPRLLSLNTQRGMLLLTMSSLLRSFISDWDVGRTTSIASNARAPNTRLAVFVRRKAPIVWRNYPSPPMCWPGAGPLLHSCDPPTAQSWYI